MPCVRLALGGKLGAGRETSRGTGDHMWRAVVEGSGGVVEASGGGAVDREQETGDRGQVLWNVECGPHIVGRQSVPTYILHTY